MTTIADRAPLWEADHKTREMPLALVEGITALKRDAVSGLQAAGQADQKWAWPGPGEMEYTEIGGRKNETIYESKIKAARLENVWRGTLSAAASVPFDHWSTMGLALTSWLVMYRMSRSHATSRISCSAAS